MTVNALNPRLYSALVRLSGDVRVTSPGQRRVVRYAPDWSRGGRYTASSAVRGEQYKITCPECGHDACYISYMYGVADRRTGDDNKHLVYCFHGQCYDDSGARQRLWQSLQANGVSQIDADLHLDDRPVPEPPAITLPDRLVPVNRLSVDDAAAVYLRDERNYDLDELWRIWQVSYCQHSTASRPTVFERIVIPIYRTNPIRDAQSPGIVLAGWQARMIGSPEDDTPKYLSASGMALAQLLYNSHNAAAYSTVVVCEGVTDVWRVGPCGVAVFGHSISLRQEQLLVSTWSHGTLVMLFDNDGDDKPGAQHANQGSYDRLATRFAGGAVLVTLPEGQDPGDFDREELWRLIHDAAAQQGVTLDLSPSTNPTTPGPGTMISAGAATAVNPERRIIRHLLGDSGRTDFSTTSTEKLRARIASDGFEFVLNEIERPLLPVVGAMTRNGIRLDVDFLDNLYVELPRCMEINRAEIRRIVGKDINVTNSRALADLLYVELGLTVPRWTQADNPSVKLKTLQTLTDRHEVVRPIINFLDLTAIHGFTEQLLQRINRGTGRIHCHLDPLGTATGRFSCTNPPLHSTPRLLRELFIADHDHLLIEADFSQIELRVLADISQDPNLVQAFRDGIDLHRRTAALALGIHEEAVTPQHRNEIGKAVNFGVIYGMGSNKLAEELDVDPPDAQRFLDGFWGEYPVVSRWIREIQHVAARDGYVLTRYGRRRWLHGDAYINGANTIIQGTAADINKLALICLYRELPRDCRLLLTVHDSVLVEVPENRAQEMAVRIKAIMETPPPNFTIPLVVDVGVGENWAACKSDAS